jgi:putative DNA primase/helicase
MRHLEPDQESLRYVLQVIAYPIANPGAKLNVGLVFKGCPGAGKSLLTEILMAIYGHANVSKIGNRELGAQFNGFMACRQLIVCEEIKGDGDLRHDAEGMKDWISGHEVFVNEKYVKAYSVRNVANFLFLSNHRLPLFIQKHDRRYAVVDTQTPLGDALGTEIKAWAMSGGISCVRYFLEHEVDFTGFTPTANARPTAAKLAVIDAGRSAIERFAQNVMDDADRPVLATTRKLYYLAEREINLGPGKHTQLTNAFEDAGAVCVRRDSGSTPSCVT